MCLVGTPCTHLNTLNFDSSLVFKFKFDDMPITVIYFEKIMFRFASSKFRLISKLRKKLKHENHMAIVNFSLKELKFNLRSYIEDPGLPLHCHRRTQVSFVPSFSWLSVSQTLYLNHYLSNALTLGQRNSVRGLQDSG